MPFLDMNDETLQTYLDESRDHLADIEGDLLQIEQDGAAIDEELVNKVFRSAHSIKGGAGFFRLSTLRDLAHKIENVLDLVRKRELIPNPEIINILLISFDKLRELVNAPQESNDADVSEFIESLVSLTQSGLPQEKKETIRRMVDVCLPSGRPVIQIPEYDYQKTVENNHYIYLVEYDLIHDLQSRGKAPLEFFRSLVGTGTIEETVTDYEAVGNLEDPGEIHRIPVYFLFSTIIKPKKIGHLFEVEPERIHVVFDPSEGPTEMIQFREEAVSGGASTAIREISEEEAPAEGAAPPKDTAPSQEPAPEEPASEEPAAEAPGAESAAASKKGSSSSGSSGAGTGGGGGKSETLRVRVNLLEQLMTLAGELVLNRNEMNEAVSRFDQKAIQLSAQKINQVTSELQEAIMMTRMQSVGVIFNKFPRVVRDMTRSLGKEISLNIEGSDVELDKTLIEGLGDPLTHMVRNAVDHGIEMPDVRQKAGKPREGSVFLKAFHEAGQVNIELQDDGAGLDGDYLARKAVEKGLLTPEELKGMSAKEKVQIIFMPGFSTAQKVTDISGRGVGMDVVRSNLEQMGGLIDIDSTPGQGSSFRIKLPLTLAIIPSLLVSMGGERFAIPQLNVSELIRISPADVAKRIEKVGQARVLKLRGDLLPLVGLDEALWGEDAAAPEEGEKPEKTINIVIISAGHLQYGVIVEELHDSLEIVVKPLGRHLKGCREYAGATILGDGRVALILDASGLAAVADLSSHARQARARMAEKKEDQEIAEETSAYLLFHNGPDEQCAMPLEGVNRIEHVSHDQIEMVGGRRVMQYKGSSLPLVRLEDAADTRSLTEEQDWTVVVFQSGQREIGLLASRPVDYIEAALTIDESTLRQPGVIGSAIIHDQTTMLVDVQEILQRVYPEWAERAQRVLPGPGGEAEGVPRPAPPLVPDEGRESSAPAGEDWHKGLRSGDSGGAAPGGGAFQPALIVLAEDSDFFRLQVRKYIEEAGHQVVAAEDGQKAWEALQEHPDAALLVTDIEMPNLDGYGLTKKVRGDERFKELPVLALTALASDENIEKGKAVGITDYQIKMDRDQLIHEISRLLAQTTGGPAPAADHLQADDFIDY